jgi:hypothetical protein
MLEECGSRSTTGLAALWLELTKGGAEAMQAAKHKHASDRPTIFIALLAFGTASDAVQDSFESIRRAVDDKFARRGRPRPVIDARRTRRVVANCARATAVIAVAPAACLG